jgi:hypothetical protein
MGLLELPQARRRLRLAGIVDLVLEGQKRLAPALSLFDMEADGFSRLDTSSSCLARSSPPLPIRLLRSRLSLAMAAALSARCFCNPGKLALRSRSTFSSEAASARASS